MKIDKDDPRLTAHALGELDDNERAEVEALVQTDADARAVVDEIRQTAALLETELAGEPEIHLTTDQRQAIEFAAVGQNGRVPTSPTAGVSFFRRHRAGLAMAAALVFVVTSIGLLLPELRSARELSKKQLATSSIKSFGTSCKVYARNDEVAARLKNTATSSRVHTGDNENEPSVIVDALESANNFRLRAYNGPKQGGRGSGEGQNVLFADGHATFGEKATSGQRNDLIVGTSPREYHQTMEMVEKAHSRNEADGETQGASDGETRFLALSQTPSEEVRKLIDQLRAEEVGTRAGENENGRPVDRLPDRSPDCRDANRSGSEYSVVADSVTLRQARSAPTGSPVGAAGNPVAASTWTYDDSGSTEDLEEDESDPEVGARYLALLPAHLAAVEGRSSESYEPIFANPFKTVAQQPLSTFSIDVDTASYANIRRYLMGGMLPPRNAVRIEEMVNYFDYDYPLPDKDEPFSVNIEVAECPWDSDHRLARIGIKGWEFEDEDRPPANLVFLIDVSGSMQDHNKLPLLRESLEMLVAELPAYDQVAMVVYAGASGLVLPSTSCKSKGEIRDAITRLQAGGSTNDVATENFIEGGINRVILATDGDFNVGTTNRGDLTELIEEKAKSGVFLSVLGFGMGNLKDATLETLADKGNGNYAYIDNINEAQKVLIDQMGGTLITIAKDVKIQVEFNPLEVQAYRLVGYENRVMAARDFNDDTKDAGEIGAGHTVTAFYEIVPAGLSADIEDIDPLKYQDDAGSPSVAAETGEMMTVKLRYKEPDGDTSSLIEMAVFDEGLTIDEASDDFAFATAVASFGMLLRGSEYSGAFTYTDVLDMADTALGEDRFGYRAEFMDLVRKAIEIDN